MSKRQQTSPTLPDDLVRHPRYRNTILRSGYKVHATTLQRALESWKYAGETCFVESVIPADLSKQGESVVPCECYFDVLKRCRDCGLPFLFHAAEQKYWYETLKFNLSADCVRCQVCRRSLRQVRRSFARYTQRDSANDLTDAEFAELHDDVVLLWQERLLASEQTLRTLKNRALRRLPNHQSTRALVAILQSSSDTSDR